MSEKRDEATLRVYAALEKYERALDEAAALGADLAAELPRARINANFAAEVGQGAFTHFIGSLGDLVVARGRVVDGHRELATVRRRFSLPVVSNGDKTGLPAANPMEETRPLRAA
jgi:hypothetical protein